MPDEKNCTTVHCCKNTNVTPLIHSSDLISSALYHSIIVLSIIYLLLRPKIRDVHFFFKQMLATLTLYFYFYPPPTDFFEQWSGVIILGTVAYGVTMVLA